MTLLLFERSVARLHRAPRCAADYQTKISGPLFDHIDLHLEVPAVLPADLSRPALQARTHVEADANFWRQSPPDGEGRALPTQKVAITP